MEAFEQIRMEYSEHFSEVFKTITTDNGSEFARLSDSAYSMDIQLSMFNLLLQLSNDIIYTDDPYKNEHREYYMRDIQADLDWYGKTYAEIGIRNRVFIDNDLPANVVERILSEYNLTDRQGI